jgi:hypothetical protein
MANKTGSMAKTKKMVVEQAPEAVKPTEQAPEQTLSNKPKVEKEVKERVYNKMNMYNPLTKKHDEQGIKGLINEKKTKWGAVIRIWNGQQAGFEVQKGYVWTTTCETHNKKSFHKSFKEAAAASAHLDWCDECVKASALYEQTKVELLKKKSAAKTTTEQAPSVTPSDTPKQPKTKRAALAEKLVKGSKKS